MPLATSSRHSSTATCGQEGPEGGQACAGPQAASHADHTCLQARSVGPTLVATAHAASLHPPTMCGRPSLPTRRRSARASAREPRSQYCS